MKYLRLLLLLPALLLSGCIDFAQSLWVNEDGSGRMQLTIGLSEQLMKVTGALKADKDLCSEFYRDKDHLSQQPGIRTVEMKHQLEAGIYYCILDISVDDFQKLNLLQGEALKDSQATREKQDYDANFELKRKDDTGTFTQLIRNRIAERKRNPDTSIDAQAEHIAKTLLAQMVTGKYWVVTLHAPVITKTNGKLSEDKKTVTWKIPFYDLFISEDYQLEMQAEFIIKLPWYKKVWKWVT